MIILHELVSDAQLREVTAIVVLGKKIRADRRKPPGESAARLRLMFFRSGTSVGWSFAETRP
jgi:hypothetical protein